jgi:hypothetical protein
MKPDTELTQDVLRDLLNYDPANGCFTWRVLRRGRAAEGSVAGSIDTKGRRQIKVLGRPYFAHRLAFLWMTGRWPTNTVDHIDRDFTNNAWANLREATHSEQAINRVGVRRKPDAQHLPKGVHALRGGQYYAAIGTHGRVKRIGTYATIEEAAQAFTAAALARSTEFVPPEVKQESHSS